MIPPNWLLRVVLVEIAYVGVLAIADLRTGG
jgi:hypothetical protein